MNGPDEVGLYDMRVPAGAVTPSDLVACRVCAALVFGPDLDQHTWWHLDDRTQAAPINLAGGKP